MRQLLRLGLVLALGAFCSHAYPSEPKEDRASVYHNNISSDGHDEASSYEISNSVSASSYKQLSKRADKPFLGNWYIPLKWEHTRWKQEIGFKKAFVWEDHSPRPAPEPGVDAESRAQFAEFANDFIKGFQPARQTTRVTHRIGQKYIDVMGVGFVRNAASLLKAWNRPGKNKSQHELRLGYLEGLDKSDLTVQDVISQMINPSGPEQDEDVINALHEEELNGDLQEEMQRQDPIKRGVFVHHSLPLMVAYILYDKKYKGDFDAAWYAYEKTMAGQYHFKYEEQPQAEEESEPEEQNVSEWESKGTDIIKGEPLQFKAQPAASFGLPRHPLTPTLGKERVLINPDQISDIGSDTQETTPAAQPAGSFGSPRQSLIPRLGKDRALITPDQISDISSDTQGTSSDAQPQDKARSKDETPAAIVAALEDYEAYENSSTFTSLEDEEERLSTIEEGDETLEDEDEAQNLHQQNSVQNNGNPFTEVQDNQNSVQNNGNSFNEAQGNQDLVHNNGNPFNDAQDDQQLVRNPWNPFNNPLHDPDSPGQELQQGSDSQQNPAHQRLPQQESTQVGDDDNWSVGSDGENSSDSGSFQDFAMDELEDMARQRRQRQGEVQEQEGEEGAENQGVQTDPDTDEFEFDAMLKELRQGTNQNTGNNGNSQGVSGAGGTGGTAGGTNDNINEFEAKWNQLNGEGRNTNGMEATFQNSAGNDGKGSNTEEEDPDSTAHRADQPFTAATELSFADFLRKQQSRRATR
ncbi:MAG: hypothetical protein M1831_002420 [Alyxoria varia]|nr:MAG: hypothetical protein M1831_002420 [Alyxoria varia]